MTLNVVMIPDAEHCERVTAFVWVVFEGTGANAGLKTCVVADNAADAAAIVRGRALNGAPVTVRRAVPADLDLVVFEPETSLD